MGPAPGAAKTCAQLCAAATRNQYSSTSCASWARALARQQLHRYRCLASHSDKTLPRQATVLTTRKLPWKTIFLGKPSSTSAATGFVSCSSFNIRQPVIVGASGSEIRASSTFGFVSTSYRRLPSPLLRIRCLRPGPCTSATSSQLLQNRGLAKPSLPNAGGMPDHSDRLHPSAAAAAGGPAPSNGHSDERLHMHTNRLVLEQSPYLLQHAHNPVDWYPWSEEAFTRSRVEDKPIFLSVGYATCHWCHVMERESFENEEIAELLNKDFISIKVDREERPDVDRVYMTYVQAVSGSGGWPMSVWLTPSLEPFYGGTYYPPKDRFVQGQLAVPGLSTVLRRIASLWRTNRQDLKDKASSTLAQLTEALTEAAAAPAGSSEVHASSAAGATVPTGGAALSPALASAAVDACAHDLARRYDAEFGGFGGAPKFPRPCEINLLLRAASRQMDQGDPLAAQRLRSMALHSLTAMASGGMYDHLGGGFHRYSVDELWHVPHFEKMLYDNSQLVASYLAAFQITGDKQYALVARGVLDYLLRDMTSPGGGLYSAEDADSEDPHSYTTATAGRSSSSSSSKSSSSSSSRGAGGGAHHHGERKEGAFYVWDHSEVMSVLGPELGPFFCLVYGIDEEGNCNRSFRSDPHSEFEGKNVTYIATQPEVAAARLGLPYASDPAEAARRLAAARERLQAARAARPRPSLDDKIVMAWNGMAIGAFAVASRALVSEQQVERLFPSEGRPAGAYLHAAQRVASFVRHHLWDPAAGAGGGRLRRSFCKGPSAVQGFADDYSALISGLLDLYECGGGREWLEWAMQLQAVQDQLFWDSHSGGYFSTTDPASADADPSIRIRIKDDYDGAEPTASSVAAINLLRLAGMVPERPSPASYGGAAGAFEVPSISYDEAAQRTLAGFAARLTQSPLAVPHMCCAAHMLTKRPARQVIVAGPAGAPDTSALLDAVHASYCPDKVVLVLDPTNPGDLEFWRARNPSAHDMVARHFAKTQQSREGPASGAGGPGPTSGATAMTATAFICQNYTCQAPTTDPVRVRQLLTQQATLGSAQPQLQHFDVKL